MRLLETDLVSAFFSQLDHRNQIETRFFALRLSR